MRKVIIFTVWRKYGRFRVFVQIEFGPMSIM